MAKKVAYISDYSLAEYNSVRDILYSIMHHNVMLNCEQIIIRANGSDSFRSYSEFINGYKTYECELFNRFEDITKNDKLSWLEKTKFGFKYIVLKICSKIRRIRSIYPEWQNIKYLKKILYMEKPDIVIYFSQKPRKNFHKICKKINTPYISLLYDTYIESPYINKIKGAKIEKQAIQHSAGYFIPNFFYPGYITNYGYDNIYSYKLPLLIPKEEVLSAYKNSKETFEFTYFGQMQTFRESKKVKEIFKALNLSLDIFTSQLKRSDETYIYHEAITQQELYKTVAQSKFLVALDNGSPYEKYLPSKAYLYVSFTKPIIAFGNNDHSAMKEFFKDYPFFYYYNIEKSSLDDLADFINTDFKTTFCEDLYSKYEDYLPEKALIPVINLVDSTVNIL